MGYGAFYVICPKASSQYVTPLSGPTYGSDLWHWKRRSDSVVLATIEGEIEGNCFPGRRRTAWIDDVWR